MAYIRRKDLRKVGKKKLANPNSSALLLKIKWGQNQKVRKKVPVFNRRGKKV